MHSALRHFQRAVEVSREAGLLRVEIPNVCMVGHCLTWIGEGAAGLREVRRAVELSNRIGLAQTEVMTLESIGFALLFDGAYEEAEPWIEKAMVAARNAGARRYLAVDCTLLAACRRQQGRIAEARELLAEAFELAKQIGIGFIGPTILSAMASAAEAPAERKRLLQEGEAILESCVAHARIMFYRDAIEATLEDRDWDEALRHADALEEFVRPEPLLYAGLVVARARILTALGQRGAEPAILAELNSLRAQVARPGSRGLLPRIDAALASA